MTRIPRLPVCLPVSCLFSRDSLASTLAPHPQQTHDCSRVCNSSLVSRETPAADPLLTPSLCFERRVVAASCVGEAVAAPEPRFPSCTSLFNSLRLTSSSAADALASLDRETSVARVTCDPRFLTQTAQTLASSHAHAFFARSKGQEKRRLSPVKSNLQSSPVSLEARFA